VGEECMVHPRAEVGSVTGKAIAGGLSSCSLAGHIGCLTRGACRQSLLWNRVVGVAFFKGYGRTVFGMP